MSDFLSQLAKQVNQQNTSQGNQSQNTDWLDLLTELQEVILPSYNQSVRVRSLSLKEDFSLTANDLVSVPIILKTVLEVIWNALQDKDFFSNSFETFLRKTILSKDIQVLALGILQATYSKVFAFGVCEKCNEIETFELPVSEIKIDKFEPKLVNFEETKTVTLDLPKATLTFEIGYPTTADILQNYFYLLKTNDPAALISDDADLVRKVLLSDLYLKNLHRIFARVIKRFTIVRKPDNQLVLDISRPNDIYLTSPESFAQYNTFINELSKLPINIETKLIEEINKQLDEPIVAFATTEEPECKCGGKASVIIEPLFFLYFKVFIQPTN